jgi:hypothetical protein
MNTNAILKTSAVVLVLAAIPATVMWRSDEKPAATSRQTSVSAAPPRRTAQVPTAEQSPATKSSVVRKPVASSPPPKDQALADTPGDFATQIRSVLSGEAGEDEQLAFWQAVKSGEKLDRLIGDLQQATSVAKDDVDSRLTLGLAYVAKIWSMPDGPEKAIWAGKAEGVWKEVLAVEPGNWEAQRNIAFSYSRYPEFLNKTNDAIAEYETTLALQEAAPEPRKGFADSYLEMARLQMRTGDSGSALSTLERGAAAHPDNTAITQQLEVIRRTRNSGERQE